MSLHSAFAAVSDRSRLAHRQSNSAGNTAGRTSLLLLLRPQKHIDPLLKRSHGPPVAATCRTLRRWLSLRQGQWRYHACALRQGTTASGKRTSPCTTLLLPAIRSSGSQPRLRSSLSLRKLTIMRSPSTPTMIPETEKRAFAISLNRLIAAPWLVISCRTVGPHCHRQYLPSRHRDRDRPVSLRPQPIGRPAPANFGMVVRINLSFP